MSKHISVTAETYDRLKRYCEATGRSMSSVIDHVTQDCVIKEPDPQPHGTVDAMKTLATYHAESSRLLGLDG